MKLETLTYFVRVFILIIYFSISPSLKKNLLAIDPDLKEFNCAKKIY